MGIELRVDVRRMAAMTENDLDGYADDWPTMRVPVRAQLPDGGWGAVDASCLDRESFISWVCSRGAVSSWALDLLLAWQGHEQLSEARGEIRERRWTAGEELPASDRRIVVALNEPARHHHAALEVDGEEQVRLDWDTRDGEAFDVADAARILRKLTAEWRVSPENVHLPSGSLGTAIMGVALYSVGAKPTSRRLIDVLDDEEEEP